MPRMRAPSPGGRPTAERASEISDRILVAAATAFARLGGRLSLDDIAADAQVSKQAIYRRYAGKADLIRAVINHALDAILISEDTPIPSDPIGALRHWAWRIFVNNSGADSADFSRHLHAMMIDSDEISQAVVHWQERLLEPIEAALRALPPRALRGVDPREVATILYDITATGARRASEDARHRPSTDADRRARFDARWHLFAAMLDL